jgi:hypothetical protein
VTPTRWDKYPGNDTAYSQIHGTKDDALYVRITCVYESDRDEIYQMLLDSEFKVAAVSAGYDSEIARLREERDDLRATFDVGWAANKRAVKMWQEAHPGNDLVWPDHADLVVWLMEQLVAKREQDGYGKPDDTITCSAAVKNTYEDGVRK